MPAKRSERGVPLPGVWQVCVLIAALAATWIIWSEFRRWITPPDSTAKYDAGANLRAILSLSNDGQPGLDRLTILLDSDDVNTRRNALLALAELGPDGQPSLVAIRLRFSDQESPVRQAALIAFSKICDDPAQILAATAGFLADSEPQVRQLALGILQSAGQRAIPALIAMARSESADVRLLVIRLLTDADDDRDPGEVNAVLRSLMDDRDDEVRMKALAQVVARGAADLDEIRGWLRDDDPKMVNAGLAAIPILGPESVAALPELQALLDDNSGTRPVLLAALASLKSAARPLIPVLLKRSSAGSPGSRLATAKALAEIGATPDDVVPILTSIFTEKDDYYIGPQARQLLARIDPAEGRRQVSQLTGQLANKEASLDGNDPDLQALSSFRSLAQEAVPLLMRLLSHTDQHVRSTAMSILRGIGSDAAPAVPILMGFINRKPSSVPEYHDVGPAIEALGGVGPAARPAVPRLIELINGNSHDTLLRDRIVHALGQIGETSPEVIAALRRELTMTAFQSDAGRIPQEPRTRLFALQALLLLAGDSGMALSDLMPLLDDVEHGIRMQAALAIGRRQVDRRGAIPPLIDALSDPNIYTRTTAALALGEIGPDAGASVPVLRDLLRDGRNHVCNLARRIRSRSGTVMFTADMQFMFVPEGIELQRVSVAEVARWAISAIETPD